MESNCLQKVTESKDDKITNSSNERLEQEISPESVESARSWEEFQNRLEKLSSSVEEVAFKSHKRGIPVSTDAEAVENDSEGVTLADIQAKLTGLRELVQDKATLIWLELRAMRKEQELFSKYGSGEKGSHLATRKNEAIVELVRSTVNLQIKDAENVRDVQNLKKPLGWHFVGTFRLDNRGKDIPIHVSLSYEKRPPSDLQPPQALKLSICFPRLNTLTSSLGVSTYEGCYMNLQILDKNDDPIFAKSFRVETKGGTCGEEHNAHTLCNSATYVDPSFFPWNSWIDFWYAKGVFVQESPTKKNQLCYDIGLKMEICQLKARPFQFAADSGKVTAAFAIQEASALPKYIPFAHPDFADVKFIVGANEELLPLKSYRCVLAARSPIFENILKESQTDEIFIANFSPRAVTAYLNFLHGTEEGIWLENIDLNLEVLEFGHYYFVADIMDRAVKNILATRNQFFTIESAAEVIRVGSRCGIPALQQRASQWIKLNT